MMGEGYSAKVQVQGSLLIATYLGKSDCPTMGLSSQKEISQLQSDTLCLTLIKSVKPLLAHYSPGHHPLK